MDYKLLALTVVFKPLTTILLFFMIGRADTRVRKAIFAGTVFSLIGDTTLIFSEETTVLDLASRLGLHTVHAKAVAQVFLATGVFGFLLTHVCYVVGFSKVAVLSWRPFVAALLAASASTTTILAVRPNASAFVLPISIYATGLTAMVVTAWATTGGPLVFARYAAVGAIGFYIGDTSIVLNKFYFVPDGLPHACLLTTGVYWVGQLGIVTAARGGTQSPPGNQIAQVPVRRSELGLEVE
jgi:uncharacterized membrane protein YhhN